MSKNILENEEEEEIKCNKKLKIDLASDLEDAELNEIESSDSIEQKADSFGICCRINREFKQFSGLVKQM